MNKSKCLTKKDLNGVITFKHLLNTFYVLSAVVVLGYTYEAIRKTAYEEGEKYGVYSYMSIMNKPDGYIQQRRNDSKYDGCRSAKSKYHVGLNDNFCEEIYK